MIRNFSLMSLNSIQQSQRQPQVTPFEFNSRTRLTFIERIPADTAPESTAPPSSRAGSVCLQLTPNRGEFPGGVHYHHAFQILQ